ncbi:MAG: type II toxin-antitoxin system RelE/ParE family toxin [Leptospiraceae bacterium]|nr:type II toxin-antitoxin system RelE/ParE family toxin [Leptospiraceae bacterium]
MALKLWKKLEVDLQAKFKFNPQAIQQLKDSMEWYEEQKADLGREFSEEIFSKIEQISNRPESYSIVFDDVRRASLSRFPFFIYYAFRDAIVFILSVWHKKRETHPKVEKG